MTATNTFTWNTGTSTWNTSGNWTGNPGGSGAFAVGAAGNSYLFLLGAGGGSAYTVTLATATVNAGAINFTSANATVQISTGHLLKSNGKAAAGGTLTMTAGTLSMAGGTAQYTTFSVGGTGLITGFGTLQNPAVTGATLGTSGSGAVLATGGTLTIQGLSSSDLLDVSGNLEIDASGVLQFAETTIANGSGTTVNYQNAAGTMSNDNTSGNYSINGPLNTDTFNATLEHMAVGTTAGSSAGASVIDLDNQIVSSSSILGTTLKVTAGGANYIWQTSGTSFVGDTLNYASDGNGGTNIWVDTQPCYVEGTRVLTERGEVAVEELAEGDMVVTLAGETRSLAAVTWIGHRRMSLLQHPQPGLVAPIRVLKHAFGENLPSRDLLVSPDHCLFVDGKLIPAKLLINDMTIVQEHGATSVHYYHIELARHSVILAEGLPAESYLDTGNRAMFANAGLAMVLHPDFTVNESLKCWETDACAPLAVSRDLVQPVWRASWSTPRRSAIAVRTSPPRPTRSCAWWWMAAPPAGIERRRPLVFALPAGASSMRLTSRASVPSDTAAYLGDWRHFGIAVRRIVVRDSRGLTELPPDHPGLTQGWHWSSECRYDVALDGWRCRSAD